MKGNAPQAVKPCNVSTSNGANHFLITAFIADKLQLHSLPADRKLHIGAVDKREVTGDVSHRKAEADGIIVFFHQIRQRCIQLFTQRTVFFVLGKLTDNQPQSFSALPPVSGYTSSAPRHGTFADVFEKQHRSFGGNVVRSAAKPVSHRHVSSAQHSSCRALPVQAMLLASI